jgi:hypothetical protein
VFGQRETLALAIQHHALGAWNLSDKGQNVKLFVRFVVLGDLFDIKLTIINDISQKISMIIKKVNTQNNKLG